MYYIEYCLRNTTKQRACLDNANLRHLYKNMVSTSTPTFNGDGTVTLFQFLIRSVEETDIQQLLEAQLSVLASQFLTGPACEQFDAKFGEYSRGRLTASSVIFDYLLGNYTTPQNIRKAGNYPHSLRQDAS